MNTECEKCGACNRDRLMNQDEVAGLLSVSTRTLEYWRSKGCSNLRFVKVGKLARYKESDVQAYIGQLAD